MTDGLTASDVAVLTGGTGKNDGFGGDWGAWIILFLIFGMFGCCLLYTSDAADD